MPGGSTTSVPASADSPTPEQLKLILERARERRLFVAWEYRPWNGYILGTVRPEGEIKVYTPSHLAGANHKASFFDSLAVTCGGPGPLPKHSFNTTALSSLLIQLAAHPDCAFITFSADFRKTSGKIFRTILRRPLGQEKRHLSNDAEETVIRAAFDAGIFIEP